MDFLLGSDIHSPRGFIEKEESGLTVDPLSKDYFLLIAPRKGLCRAGRFGRFDSHALNQTMGRFPFGLSVEAKELGKGLERWKGQVVFHGLGQYQPLALAILWNQRHASIHGVMNLEALGHGLTVQGDASGVDGVQTKDGSGNLSASRTHQAGKAQDFSGLNGKVDVIEYSCK